MSRVALVTGGGGFVGRPAVEALRARGFEVHAPSSREADLLDPRAAEALLESLRPTHLLHLAWAVEPGAFWHTPENVVWLEASLRLVRAFAAAGGERVITVGSCAEYDWSAGGTFAEDAPARPATLYGAAKNALGSVAGAYAEQAGIGHAHARLFFLFGPGEPAARLVPSVARAVMAGHEAPTTEGLQVRDFLGVGDAAAGLAALLDSDAAGPHNVGAGAGIAVADLVRAVASAAGDPDLLRVGALPTRPGEPDAIVADTTRIRAATGWAPAAPLSEALAEAVAWWRGRAEPT